MLLKETKMNRVLIFCATKEKTRRLYQELKKSGIKAQEIHSTLDQPARVNAMNLFRSGDIPVLVATDIVSRGIDVEDIDVVINYDVPREGEDYIHRIGRTARASAEGTAITFINQRDQLAFAAIEALLGQEVEKFAVPAELGAAPEYNPKAKKNSGSHRRRWGGRARAKKNKK